METRINLQIEITAYLDTDICYLPTKKSPICSLADPFYFDMDPDPFRGKTAPDPT